MTYIPRANFKEDPQAERPELKKDENRIAALLENQIASGDEPRRMGTFV
jgi:hypothetical protein